MTMRKLAIFLFGVMFLWSVPTLAEVITLPSDQWLEWVHRDGIVMAGSWEALPFRVRRDGANRYTPTPDQQAAWDREHSPEMIEQLKSLGVNFIMMHCYKGLGLAAEKESMADAVQFSRLCHKANVKVGVYNYSGSFLWEPFFKEVPQAKDWILLDETGNPITYNSRTSYRYSWNRNHPQAVAFYRNLVKFAVEEVKTDLIHFDNYHASAGFDAQSVQDFRKYLRATFSPDQLKQAGIDANSVLPPKKQAPPNLLKFAWRDFECSYLANSYLDMSRYARSLRKDILMECNPGGVPRTTRPPVDQARILPGGEAFWDESSTSGWKNGKLTTRIRTYKVGRLMDNMAFSYITSPLEAAESMAFNHPDCLGCICWFEYGNIVVKPSSKQPPNPQLKPYIRFFHARRDLFRGADVVADVAILRSFPSQVFAPPEYQEMNAAVEDELIARRIPFQIIYDQHLRNLKRWPALVLAGCVAMSDSQIDAVEAFVRDGGKLCIVGPVATHDEWMKPRDRKVFTDLPTNAVAYVDNTAGAIPALDKLCGNAYSFMANCPGQVCTELTRQTNRVLVHMVNYNPDQPIDNINVQVRIPQGRRPETILVADPEQSTDIKVPFERDADLVRFTVPRLSVYAVASVQIN